MKLLLVAVVLALLLIAGLAVGLYHFWGWKGLIAYPFLLLVILWLGKVVVGKMVRGFFLNLMNLKGAVLEGASFELHSVRPVAKPKEWAETEEEEPEEDEEPDDTAEPETPVARNGDPADEDDEDDEETESDEEEEEEPKQPQHYYEIDLTISPTQPKCMRLWEPGELVLTSAPRKGLMELADDSVSELLECEVWDGSKFDEDDPGKYEGSQRLRIVFSVNQGLRTAHLNYYGHSLGPISLPEWTPPATEPATPEA